MFYDTDREKAVVKINGSWHDIPCALIADPLYNIFGQGVFIPCTSLTVDPTSLTFTASGSQTITATVEPSNTTDTVLWESMIVLLRW